MRLCNRTKQLINKFLSLVALFYYTRLVENIKNIFYLCGQNNRNDSHRT